MEKILITGASGFIGTNLLEYYKDRFTVLNIDFEKPQNVKHIAYWKNLDIRDYNSLEKAMLEFSPDYILHMAAKTDFYGKTIDDYDANTVGTENVLKVSQKISGLKKIIITSSQAVTGGGYQPKHQKDYKTVTVYGDSKVKTEELTWALHPNCDWAIIRPTSIWGPWFRVPYRNFFDLVHKRMYFHIGHKSTTKTYGYIGNSVYQIDRILFTDTTDEDNKVFYIGDNPPINIEDWANEVGTEMGINIHRLPIPLLKSVAWFGDILYKVAKIKFPMNSRRLHNMTLTNGNIRNLDKTYKIAPNPPYTRMQGVKDTVKWLGYNKK